MLILENLLCSARFIKSFYPVIKMNWRFIYPNIRKVLISAIVSLIWTALSIFFQPAFKCKPCVELCVSIWPRLIKNCDCCFTSTDFYAQVFFMIILPFMISYIAISLKELVSQVKK